MVVGGVEGECVGAVGQVRRPSRCEMTAVVVEDVHPAALGGDVDAVGGGVVHQNIRCLANLPAVDHRPVDQADGDHGGIGLTADERYLLGVVERLSVRMVAARGRDSFGDGVGVGVDDGEFVSALHRDDHLVEETVVDDIAHLAAERDGGADRPVLASITDSLPALSLVVQTVFRIGSKAKPSR